MRRVGGGAIGTMLLLAASSCDPCGGTPSCRGDPGISYTGQFVVRTTGASVAGVRVTFARVDGIELMADTIRATSDASGYFVLRGDAWFEGSARGNLIVEPPPPHPPYTVNGVVLSAKRVRGDGGVLGRLVVDPYLQVLGELRDPKTGDVVAGATVVISTDPALVTPDSTVITSDEHGRFFWSPTALGYDSITVRFAVRRAGDTTVLMLERRITPQHTDGFVRFLSLGPGRSVRYAGLVSRRGTDAYLPGAFLEFVRTGGVAITPDSVRYPINVADGAFYLLFDPPDSGRVVGTVTIGAPAPFENEVFPNFVLNVRDDDTFTFLGRFGYGPGATLDATFAYRSTGQPLENGILVRPYRVSGLPVLERQTPFGVDNLVRALENGAFKHTFGTTETGDVVVDIEVRLRAPLAWDTVRAVVVPSRLSDVPTPFNFLVGPP